jgi:hypothetical protein
VRIEPRSHSTGVVFATDAPLHMNNEKLIWWFTKPSN